MPDPVASPPCGNPRLKSIVVVPSPQAQVSSSDDMDGWTEDRSRKPGGARRPPLLVQGGRRAPLRSSRRPNFNAVASRKAFLSRFKGLCLRCLSPHHRHVDCRAPLHCIECKLPGHFARECPKNPRNIRDGGSAKERLGPAVGRGPVRKRLRFPSPQTAMPAAYHVDQDRATSFSSSRPPSSIRSPPCAATSCCSPRRPSSTPPARCRWGAPSIRSSTPCLICRG